MTTIQAVRHAGVLAAAALVAITIGTKPVYAAEGDNSAPNAENAAKKKVAQKKATVKENKNSASEPVTTQKGLQGYRPDSDSNY